MACVQFKLCSKFADDEEMAPCVDLRGPGMVLLPPLWDSAWLMAMRSQDQEEKGFPEGQDQHLKAQRSERAGWVQETSRWVFLRYECREGDSGR